MKLVKIYVLVCPIDLKVRYIGRTTTSLSNRLSQHIHEALKQECVYTHKANWIQKLHRHNCRPVIRKLCEIEGWSESYILEQSLIEKYSSRLLNHRDRGMGSNYPKSELHRSKIGDALREGYLTGKIKHPRSKTVYYYDKQGKYLGCFGSVKEASERLNIYRSSIEKVLSGTHVQVKGYRFTYKKRSMPDVSTYLKGNNTRVVVSKDGVKHSFGTVKSCREFFQLKGFANFKQTSNTLKRLGNIVST